MQILSFSQGEALETLTLWQMKRAVANPAERVIPKTESLSVCVLREVRGARVPGCLSSDLNHREILCNHKRTLV